MSSYIAAYPLYLFYKIVQHSNGQKLDKETNVCVDFDIFRSDGKCLKVEFDVCVNLQDTIPGFAYGLQGMRIDEIREIFIHPSLAYGVHTMFEKGIYLKILVKLRKIVDGVAVLPKMQLIDLTFICNEDFQKACEATHQQCVKCLGSLRRNFLTIWPTVDQNAVINEFEHLIIVNYPEKN